MSNLIVGVLNYFSDQLNFPNSSIFCAICQHCYHQTVPRERGLEVVGVESGLRVGWGHIFMRIFLVDWFVVVLLAITGF